jgi:predicted dienelactone hydrolase
MKKLLWVLAVLAIVLAILGSVLKNGRQAELFPTGSESEARIQAGPLQVQQYTTSFIDESRPTNANGDYAGDSVRRFEGSVWHPAGAAEGPFPLVVYSHGFTSSWEGGAYLAEQLASLGYVVVSVSYPLTHMNAPGGPNAIDVVNQAADVSFLIDSLLQQSATTGHTLEGMIDETRIGATGISLGGMTTTLVSFHPEMRDPRIGAALSIAGPTAIFTDTFFSFADVPFLMLAGDIDALVPYPTNALPVITKVRSSQLVTLTGGSHTGFAGPAAPLRWLSNPDVIGCYMVSANIEESTEEPWYERIGTPEQGIDYNTENELCLMDPLPEAMNILRQHMITSVVVSSFFQSIFSPNADERDAASRFLEETMAEELSDVSYSQSSR